MTQVEAYAAVRSYFFLRPRQLEMFDEADSFEEILSAMASGDVVKARDLLIREKIIFF